MFGVILERRSASKLRVGRESSGNTRGLGVGPWIQRRIEIEEIVD